MNNIKYYSVFIILVMLIAPTIARGSRMQNTQSPLVEFLPDKLEGWDIPEKDAVYDRDTLYDYINGGAELYHSYGFKEVISRMYTAPGQPDILLDLFDMGSSQNAYGVFSQSRETIDTMYGQGSQYTQGLLLFWKDRYLVSILATPETEEAKKAVFSLARQIDSAIETEGPLPEMLNLLPQKELVQESIRYFHHYIWLNSHYFVAHDNILFIDEKTDALLAKYGGPEHRYLLLIVKYSTAQEAEMASHNFVKNYLPEPSERDIVKIEDGTWTGYKLIREYLIIVFNASTDEKALSLIEEVQATIGQSF